MELNKVIIEVIYRAFGCKVWCYELFILLDWLNDFTLRSSTEKEMYNFVLILHKFLEPIVLMQRENWYDFEFISHFFQFFTMSSISELWASFEFWCVQYNISTNISSRTMIFIQDFLKCFCVVVMIDLLFSLCFFFISLIYTWFFLLRFNSQVFSFCLTSLRFSGIHLN